MSTLGSKLVRLLAPRRWVAWLLLWSSGCLSQSYEIAAPELQRIVALAPEERGERVRVTQQTALASDTGDVPVGLDASDWPLFIASSHSHSDDSDDGESDDSAEAALAVAVVAVAAAATAAVTVGVTEGVRFDGWV